MTRPIAAFSMEDYEKLTRNAYQAAEFKRGKDKKKRKRRGALATAGMIAGGLAGAGALAAGARYGGAEASTRLANRRLTKDMETYQDGNISNVKAKGQRVNINTMRNAQSGGAKGQLDRDVQAIKDFGSKVKNYDYKGIPGRVSDAASRAYGAGRAALGTTGGKIGAGLGAAALLGGAGYGAYRMMNKKKKK
jgi:hypothetical protein